MLNESSDSSFVRTLMRQQRWTVCFPRVETAVPDSIRRFGKFHFEVEEGKDQNQETPATSFLLTERRPVYIEESVCTNTTR